MKRRMPYGSLSGDPEFDVEMARIVLERVEHEPHSQENEDTLFVELRMACDSVEKLIAALREALDAWDDREISIHGPVRDRINELRELVGS